MSEMRRVLEECDPADPSAVLWRAGAAEMPSEQALEKTLAAVHASAAVGPTRLPWWKVGAVVGAIGVGILALLHSSAKHVDREHVDRVEVQAQVAPTHELTSTPSSFVALEAPVATAPAVVATPTKAVPARTSAPAASHSGSLADEIACIDEARRAVASSDPAGALRALDRHDRDFPRGAFGPESTVLRVQALLLRGDRASANAIGQRYLANDPNTPQATRIRSLLAQSP